MQFPKKLLIIAFFSAICDELSTIYALSRYSGSYEENKLLSPLIHQFGFYANLFWIPIEFSMLAILMYSMISLGQKLSIPKQGFIIAFVISLIGFIVAIHNLTV